MACSHGVTCPAQGRISKTCGRLAALVFLANAMVAMYVFLGSGRGGTSLAGLFSHYSQFSRSKSEGMATSLWSHVASSDFDPQVSLSLLLCSSLHAAWKLAVQQRSNFAEFLERQPAAGCPGMRCLHMQS